MRSAIAAISFPPSSSACSVASRIAFRSAIWTGICRVPLRDARVQIPAEVIDPLIDLKQFRNEFANACETHLFQVYEADNNVSHLNTCVVDVILHAPPDIRF